MVIELQAIHITAGKGKVANSNDTNKLYSDTYNTVLASNEALLDRLEELDNLSDLPFKIIVRGLRGLILAMFR